ncbi:MAG: hypothetical protein KGZ86_04780 [Candidatus Latescibacteria bacterium]|nr:hypothetical protein [Candidatus Latescibacterota bacterium]
MNKNEKIKELEQTLQRNSVRVIYDNLKSEGGLCKVKDKYYIIINKNISAEQKIEILSYGLMHITTQSIRENHFPNC